MDCKPTRLLCPWDSPDQNTGVDYHFLLQGIFPTQGSNLGLLHWSFTGGSAGKECMFDRPLMFSILHKLFLIESPDAEKD